jgi:hypothetical protein
MLLLNFAHSEHPVAKLLRCKDSAWVGAKYAEQVTLDNPGTSAQTTSELSVSYHESLNRRVDSDSNCQKRVTLSIPVLQRSEEPSYGY